MQWHVCCFTWLLAPLPLWAASIPTLFVDVSDLITVISVVIDIGFVWTQLLFAAAAALPVLTPSKTCTKERWFFMFLVSFSLYVHGPILMTMIKGGFDDGRLERDWITKAMTLTFSFFFLFLLKSRQVLFLYQTVRTHPCTLEVTWQMKLFLNLLDFSSSIR